MAHYAVLDIEIHDPEQYGEYMARVAPALKSAGARYLVRGGAHEVLEGDWRPTRLVILEFPSEGALREFYESDEYRELKALRERASSGSVVTVAGIDEQPSA